MTQLPMGHLVYTPVTEGREEFLADVKRLGDAAAKYIATGDKGAFRLELADKQLEWSKRSVKRLSRV